MRIKTDEKILYIFQEVDIMKKLLALLMAAAMIVLCFAACGGSGNDTDTDTQDGKKYLIYSDKAFAPFEYLDTETNKYAGVDVDLLAAIAEDQGFTYDIKFEGFDAAMGAVQSGQADAMIAGMTIRADREEIFDFSDGYFEDGSILVVAASNDSIKSEEDLKGKKIACKIGTTSTDYAKSIQEKYGFEITTFEGSPEMYQAVLNGNADACFEDYSVVGWAIKNDSVALKTIGEIVNPGSYGFAVNKGKNAELIEMFNKGLANLKASGKYEEILNKYGYSVEK